MKLLLLEQNKDKKGTLLETIVSECMAKGETDLVFLWL